MTRRSLVFFILSGAVLSACRLDASGLGAKGEDSDSPPNDSDSQGGQMAGGSNAEGAGTAEASDAPSSSTGERPPRAPFCDMTQTELVGCYTFDGNLFDSSSHANHASAPPVTYVPGVHGDALKIDAVNPIQVLDQPSWGFAAATIEMWLKPAAIPSGNYGDTSPRAGLLDKEGQFGLFLQPGGRLSCSFGAFVTGGNVAKDKWTHVACTAGTEVTLYVNGVKVSSQPGASIAHAGVPAVIGANSPNFNDRFDGDIDDLRIFSVARSQAEICEAAGPSCVKP